eukprot:c6215_g1_i2.p1 GENE.c6215_g1_i2~~c6215_g1_i2.p1  ORF type:complete len:344 (+),score=17.18 c6215_g1_i2:122-1153(+)
MDRCFCCTLAYSHINRIYFLFMVSVVSQTCSSTQHASKRCPYSCYMHAQPVIFLLFYVSFTSSTYYVFETEALSGCNDAIRYYTSNARIFCGGLWPVFGNFIDSFTNESRENGYKIFAIVLHVPPLLTLWGVTAIVMSFAICVTWSSFYQIASMVKKTAMGQSFFSSQDVDGPVSVLSKLASRVTKAAIGIFFALTGFAVCWFLGRVNSSEMLLGGLVPFFLWFQFVWFLVILIALQSAISSLFEYRFSHSGANSRLVMPVATFGGKYASSLRSQRTNFDTTRNKSISPAARTHSEFVVANPGSWTKLDDLLVRKPHFWNTTQLPRRIVQTNLRRTQSEDEFY